MKKKWIKCLGFVLLLAAVIMVMTDNRLSFVRYEVQTDLEEEIRIVHLSDLHSWVFGEDNQDLVRVVESMKPDLILMTGDMMDKRDENAEVALALIRDLQGTAPVYFSYGNHEYEWMENTGTDLTPMLTEAGAMVLDVAYLDLDVKGQPVRLGGYHNYYRQPHMLTKDPKAIQAEREFADAFEDTERYKILMSHIPTSWLDWGQIDRYPVDLILTGHYHGGQIQIPFAGGLVAPYIGWFPPYTEGMYRGKTATCILSTGLGSSPGIPRMNNLPQVVVVDLVPDSLY